MSNSINTNIAAYFAQANITSASNASAASVSRLSSGNRIVVASDDVAALATGTSLQTAVSALKTAQSNASQGTSLLQVADGALAQIQNILQQQKSIALQAASGSLTDVDRGFLNQQFQALSSQIDTLASSTTFNGVKLLNGGISGKQNIGTNTATSSTAAQATGGDFVTIANAVPASGDTLTINGVTVTFTSSAYGTSAASGKVVIGNNIADTAANLAAFLNNSSAPQFANLHFIASATGLSAAYSGGVVNGTISLTASANFATPANLTTTSGNLTIAAGGANGLGAGTYTVGGAYSGQLLVRPDSTTTNFGAPVNLDSVKNNAAFVGKFSDIGNFTASYNGTSGKLSLSFKAGDITYTTADTTVTGATPTSLTFTGADQYGNAAGGTFTVTLAGSSVAAVANQNDANGVANQLNQALSGVSVYQNRAVSSVTNGQLATVNGVQVGNLTKFSANLQGSDFSNPTISSISIQAPAAGSTDAKFTVVVNGETYVSGSSIGNQIQKNTVIGLQNVNDPHKVLSFVTGTGTIAGSTTVSLDLSSQDKADAVANALKTAFGLDDANAALSFQIGVSTSDTIGVSIGSATTSSIFGGESLDVSTQSGANAAASVVGEAIDSVTSLRASVGALETQFNFAAAALQTSVQNQDAARGALLDTDVAAESTNFATQQVKLQAGISVLAQANQQLQALLKLIG